MGRVKGKRNGWGKGQGKGKGENKRKTPDVNVNSDPILSNPIILVVKESCELP